MEVSLKKRKQSKQNLKKLQSWMDDKRHENKNPKIRKEKDEKQELTRKEKEVSRKKKKVNKIKRETARLKRKKKREDEKKKKISEERKNK